MRPDRQVKRIRILLADDDAPTLAAIQELLQPDFDIVDTVSDGRSLVEAASDKSWVVRAAALDAIAQRDDRSLADKIVPELDDDKPVVQYLAAAAVIRLNTAPPPAASKHSTRARKPASQ